MLRHERVVANSHPSIHAPLHSALLRMLNLTILTDSDWQYHKYGSAALAGGAVITLDELPAQVVAAKPVTIGFVVR